MSTVNTRLSEIENQIRRTIDETHTGEVVVPEEFKSPPIGNQQIIEPDEPSRPKNPEQRIQHMSNASETTEGERFSALEDSAQLEDGQRRTLTAQPNDLQYEIDKFEHEKKRMVPKFVEVTFR